MNARQRIKQLEKSSGASKQKQYMCLSKSDDIEYIAKPNDGGQGETFIFKTEEEMTAYFDKHKEYKFLHIRIVRASEALKDGKHGNE